jgi:hypothetical protein
MGGALRDPADGFPRPPREGEGFLGGSTLYGGCQRGRVANAPEETDKRGMAGPDRTRMYRGSAGGMCALRGLLAWYILYIVCTMLWTRPRLSVSYHHISALVLWSAESKSGVALHRPTGSVRLEPWNEEGGYGKALSLAPIERAAHWPARRCRSEAGWGQGGEGRTAPRAGRAGRTDPNGK